LHSYGIVHRDLKLENIMMSDNSEDSVPKIVDFGLSKIIGPTETAVEPFGTLGYVAPEVLKKEPYSFSCDLWSLGCIVYALISGSLPFDHEDNKETIRMTLDEDLVFDLRCWKTASMDVKELIRGLLEKKADVRYTLDMAFSSKWF
jgi:serine/threonine protein kinase